MNVRAPQPGIKRRFRIAALPALAAAFSCAVLTACGPDKETEALRQENAALRREAENHEAVNGTNKPLTDSARAAAGLSARPGSASGPKSVAGILDARVTPKDIDDANRLGLPIYPNAKLSKLSGAQDNSVLTGGGVNIVLLETTDKLDPVVAFYTDKMTTSNADPNGRGPKNHPARADRVQDKLRVVTLTDMQPGGGMRSVTVHEDVGRTYIELMNMTGKQQIPASVLPSGAINPARSNRAADAGTQGTAANVSSTPSGSPSPAAGQLPDNDPLKPPLLLPGGKQ